MKRWYVPETFFVLSDFVVFPPPFFRKIHNISNFLKIRPVGAQLFHAERRMYGRMDGRMDGHDEADSRFSQFCESACKHVCSSTNTNNKINSSCNKSQRDAQLSQIYLIKYSTCFGQIHCPSSGASQYCIPAIGIYYASSVGCLLAWSGRTTLADTNRTGMTITCYVYTVLRYS